jgi:hypothetical protein
MIRLMIPQTLVILASIMSAQTAPVCSPTVPVDVMGKDGNPISSLSLADFHVRSGRREINVIRADYSAQPRRIVLVLNFSTAMNERQREIAVSAAQKFISAASSRVPISMVTFGGSGVHTSAFETQQSRIEEELQRAANSSDTGKGRSSLYDALMIAERTISPPVAGDAIYVITDARNSSNTAELRELREKIIAGKIRLYALLLVTGSFLGDREHVVARDVTDLVNESGGFVFLLKVSDNVPASQEAVTPNALDAQARFAFNLLTAFYTLQLDPQAPVGQRLNIKVHVSGKSTDNQVTLLYPNTIACN